ncbi:MAG: hypothetical protein ACF8Q5_11905 [Phycisphaerales bacterium JB040]
MNTHELIELAVLDALGILEQSESDEFEAAFASAAPGVQAQVRAEQARLTDIEHLLPDDQPRPELRDLVLSAVRAAISAEREPVAGRITPASRRAPAQPRIKQAPRVSPAWRAAAIALTAVVVSMFVFNSQTRDIFDEAEQVAQMDGFYDAVGAKFVDEFLTDPSTKRLAFTPVAETATDNPPRAAAWYHEKMNGQSQLFISNLQNDESEHFRVAIIDDQGRMQELTTFQNSGQLKGIEIKVDLTRFRDQIVITRFKEENRSDFSLDTIELVGQFSEAQTQG